MKKINLLFCILFLFSANIFADNYSLSFDGVDDCATFNNETLQSMIGQNWAHEKTISAWIQPLGDSPILSASWAGAWGGQAIYGQASGSGNYFGFSRAVIGGEDRIWVYNWDGNDDRIGIEYENSEWIYITLVQDNGTLYAYKNSILIGSIYTGASGNAGYQRVGGETDNGLYFSGKIDEVSVWNTALTQEQIQSYMSTSPIGNEIGLVGYWNFNEGTGTSLVDQTSNGNDGTINGATWSTDVSPLPSLTSITIDGTSGYRFLSSPVSGAIYGDLLEELWTQGMAGSDDPDNGGANVWTWNNSWNALTDLATDNYTAGSGVLVYVFADTDFDGTDNLPVTLTLNGTQNTSPVTIATNDDSWNLLGNPYGYALSIQQLAIDNAGYGAVYIWDNTTNAYKIHNGTTGDIADGLIAPFQGFWSRADAGAASYTFTESSISSDAGTNYRTTTDDIPGSAIFSFHLGDYTSSTYLSFTPEGHINLDQADASRLLPMSSMEHLTSMIHESGKSLSINNLPLELSNDISFPMDVMMLSPTEDGYETQAEQINLTWDVTNLPAGISLELKNNITGQNINLTGYPSANINLPSKGGFSMSEDFMATYPVVGDAYFTVSVNATLAGLGDDDIILPEQLVLHNAYPNPFNPSTLIRFDLLDANMVSLDIFDLNGKQVSSLINEYMIPGSHQINWNPGNLSSGIYLVNLVIGTETFNQKITFIK